MNHKPAPKPSKQAVPFFAALRTIQTRAAALIGRDTRPSNEPVRLKAETSLGFPAVELANIENPEVGPKQLEVSFLGLFGPSGALPQHYTQLIIDRKRLKDHSLREFLDLFNHRWLSFFYRAWEKHDYPSAFQTANQLKQEDVVTRILWCLIGMGTTGQRSRLRLDENSLLHYSGLLADSRPRQSSLRAMLSDWFKLPVAVLQFHGQWMQLSLGDQTCMRPITLGDSSNTQLGVNTIAGDRIWNIENRFRLRLGPLSAKKFSQFTPNAKRLYEFATLVRTYVGVQLEFDVQVVLQRSEVTGAILGDDARQSRLGWNTWLGQWPFEHDADDAIFEIEDAQTLLS